MKKIQLLVGLAVILPAFVFTTVVSAETATTSNDASVSSPAQTGPGNSEEEEKTLEQRIAEYKTSLKTQPTVAQQNVLKAKCKPAQAISKALITRVATTDKTRVQVYGDVALTLETIIPRIKEAKVDVEALAKQQTELTGMIDEYTASVKTYQAVLNDLNEIDCAADPVAFKATVEAARTARVAVSNSATAIKQYAAQTIKPSLAEAKEKLAKDTETTDSTTEATTDKAVKKEEQ